MKPIHLIIYLILLCTGSVYSDESIEKVIYPIDSQKIRIKDYEYNRYIRPQLKNIMNEFFKLLKVENKSFNIFLPLRTKFLTLQNNMKNLLMSCQFMQSDPACGEIIKKNTKLWLEIESGLLKLDESLKLSVKDLGPEEIQMSHWVFIKENAVREYVRELQANISKSYYVYENLIRSFNFKKYDVKTHRELLKQNFYTGVKFNLLIWKLVADEKQKKVEAVWANYFQKIEYHILRTDNTEYLRTNLETLNFNINLFNMQMAKGHIENKPLALSYSRQIGSRWKSILKVILN